MDASAEPPDGTAAPASPTERPSRLRRRLLAFVRLVRLDRPAGIWLLLWPTLWALWIAGAGHPPRRLLAIFLAGTVVMRSAGCIINDLADRNIDPHVRRTRARPLAARVISPYEALALFAALLLAALLLALRLNVLSLELALIGAALTVTYPLLKRFFPVPQFYLGLCFGWGVPMAFAATLGFVPRLGWLLLISTVLWAGIYDTEYAMVDRGDDLRVGVQSSAILFGDMDRLMIAVMQAMMLLSLVLLGRTLRLGESYDCGLAAAAVLFAWQQWLIRTRQREACLLAFQNNSFVGLAIFAGILVEYAARQ
ncbi:MAG TPA: 4-hydroxybenzoate octaprenyltransferase [Steroidobacteraceae bacterium]